MHLGLTVDLQTDPADWRQAEFDPPATVHALRRALESLGHRVTLLGSAEDLLAGGRERCCGIDLVFNIAEGGHGRCREAWAPTVLELFRIPYVGSDPLALAVGLDKVMSKRLAVAHGLRTPAWRCVDDAHPLPAAFPLQFPVIVKPRYEGSGIGIDPGAVVRSREALEARVRWALARFAQPVLIEEFIEHGELTVFLIGNDPPRAFPAIQRPLDPETRLACHVAAGGTPQRWLAPLELDERLDREAREAALTLFAALGCRDLARVDLRVDAEGRVYVLEINPLPSFDPEGTIGLLAEHLGLAYADLLGDILDAALRRLGVLPQPVRT
jgi:D-alanine-D-alanine ligase